MMSQSQTAMPAGMTMRQALKRSDAVVGLVRDARRLLRALANSKSLGSNDRKIRSYLATHAVRKLQIGSGPTVLDGWLSTDLEPRNPEAVFLDATKRFPFDDGTFDYVYSEHMIEHITWPQGRFMLNECWRVMRPGAKIRIATPDLARLLDLYRGLDHPLKQAYVRWITDTFLEDVEVYRASFVINNAFDNWGHRFLYDAELMTMALASAGFTDIRQCQTGESEDVHLRGIEAHGKNAGDMEMAAFETMVFEATRQAAPAATP